MPTDWQRFDIREECDIEAMIGIEVEETLSAPAVAGDTVCSSLGVEAPDTSGKASSSSSSESIVDGWASVAFGRIASGIAAPILLSAEIMSSMASVLVISSSTSQDVYIAWSEGEILLLHQFSTPTERG